MDPISALLLAVIGASIWVSEWAADVGDAVRGKGLPRHERRMQQKQHDHELRRMRLEHRHAERMAGRGGQSIGEAVADRIRKGPQHPDTYGPIRWWWYRTAKRTAERLIDEAEARDARNARGEGDWQRLGDAVGAAGRWAANRWRERHISQEPEQPRGHVDAERTDRPSTDYPDPNTPNPGTVDADVVSDPSGSRPPFVRPALPPPFGEPDAGDAQAAEDALRDWKQATTGERCPGCNNPSVGWCYLCLSAWGNSDNPDMADWAMRRRLSWEAAARDLDQPADHVESPVKATAERDADPAEPPRELQNHYSDHTENTPTTVAAVADQDHNSNNGGTEMAPNNVRVGLTGGPVTTERETGDGRLVRVTLPGSGADIPRQNHGVGVMAPMVPMTVTGTNQFLDFSEQLFTEVVRTWGNSVRDLESRGTDGELPAALHRASAHLEAALREIGLAKAEAADHQRNAQQYKNYQVASGSGDAKDYAELH